MTSTGIGLVVFQYSELWQDKTIISLEQEIDRMESNLPEMKSFILPGGHTYVAYCHIIRCICRRSERLASKLKEKEQVNPLVIKYLNRLSDYFYESIFNDCKKFEEHNFFH